MTVTPPRGLHQLIACNEPYWGAEAEVVATYWRSPVRNRHTDCLWLRRQAYKEYWDGFMPAMRALQVGLDAIDRELARRDALALASMLTDELAHYVAFAEACEALLPEHPKLDPEQLRADCNWPENATLGELRARHRREHGAIGMRAQRFTEGGYCTLYQSGMMLRGGGDADDLIARACAQVFEDEHEHMLQGVVDLGNEDLSNEAWQVMCALTVEQLRARIHMRNAQLSFPVAPDRVRALCAGEAEPLRFDYDKAGLARP